MKTRFWIYILILALTVLAVVYGRRAAKQKVNLETAQTVVEPTNVPAAIVSISNNAPTAFAAPINLQSVVPLPTDTNNGAVDPRELELQQGFEAKNIPISFYGRVLDQDGHPVSGVQIKMNGEHVFYLISQGIASTNIEMETQTDADGRFQWTSDKGDMLAVESISKDGYRLSPKAPHSFMPSSGSLLDPVIFKMWKMIGKEQLVSGRHVFGIDSGKTYTLNLINGKKIEGEAEGDLRVSIARPADAKPREKYQWAFSIEVLGGGFLESNDEFMYLAPESGYEPKIEMQFNPSSPAWTGVVKKQFFIRSRNGQVYGGVQIEVDSIYNVHSALQIDYAINPNGSRNLQP